MPNLANITVKKNDGVTDIVYTGQAPSGGDNVPAVWKATSVGTAQSHQPEFRLTAREAAKGAKRALRSTYQYPQIATNTTTGLTAVVDRLTADTNWNIPKNVPQAEINEFVSQYANLLVSQLVKDCAKSGYSAT